MSRPRPSDKQVKEWKRTAERQGWTVTVTRSQHWKFCSPTGAVVIVPSTPRISLDYNTRALLRRAGLKV